MLTVIEIIIEIIIIIASFLFVIRDYLGKKAEYFLDSIPFRVRVYILIIVIIATVIHNIPPIKNILAQLFESFSFNIFFYFFFTGVILIAFFYNPLRKSLYERRLIKIMLSNTEKGNQ